MNWRKSLHLLVVMVFLASLLPSLNVAASLNAYRDSAMAIQTQDGSRTVRVSAQGKAAFDRMGFSPMLALDYGAFVWYELSAADFAALAASEIPFSEVLDAGQLQVLTYRFDPLLMGEPALEPALRAAGDGPGFHLVQLVGPARGEWLEQLEAIGLPMLQYYPENTFLTWAEPRQVETAMAHTFVRWQGAFHPAYKLSPDLQNRNGLIRNVDIMFYNDGDIPATLASLEALGAKVLNIYPSQPDQAFFDAIVELDATAFPAIARLKPVLWLGYASPEPVLEGEMSSQILAGNHPGGVPVTGYFAYLASLGYDGTGVTWAIIDTGVDYDHPDLGPRIVGGYSFPGACNTNPGEDCTGGGHGTHVAGIVSGDAAGGFADPDGFLYGLGVAPGSGIFAMNSLLGSAWPPAGGWQEHSKRAVLGGAIGGNNSWTTGEGTAHGYQASERTHDFMVRDGNFDTPTVAEPFIEVFSAGNSGPAPMSLTAPKEAKNMIVVGSSLNYRAGNIDQVSTFSSRGPAVDGRILPTIITPGEIISSARNDLGGSCSTAIAGTNNLYAFCSGSSMAAPHASGVIALAAEWWRTFNTGADPSPAMARALLVNGAVDMGTADIPNNNEGWGRLNITNIISATVPAVYRDQIDAFGNTGEQIIMQVGVADPSKPLKITLAWSDAPGAVGANPALVNNLDLTVVNGSNTYRGNVFSSGWSATGGSADTIHNLENVYVQSPAGSATIIIDAVNISGDGIPYNGDTTDQDFALMCSNCTLTSDFSLLATPDSQGVCAPSNAVYTINVGSIMGFNSPVTLSASGNPAGTTTGFNVNPVTPPGMSTLTVGNTGAALTGSYSIDVVGVAPTSTHTTTVGLDIFDTPPGAPTLVSPTDGAADAPLQPTFMWTGSAASYTLEIASDPGFTSIVDSATVSGTSYTTGVTLLAGSTYYWRVTANNACGAAPSATFSFTTASLFCSLPNLAIPDNNPTGVSDSLVVADSGLLGDLDVSLQVDHTWVGDLVFTLSHQESGTSVTIFDRPGVPASTFGCSGNDIDATLDDEALTPVEDECGPGIPTIQGAFIPNNPLSAFDGEDLYGTWVMNASDHAGGDLGTLVQWCLVPSLTGEPDIAVDPASLSSSQLPDVQVTLPMTITNLGSTALNWTIDEAPPPPLAAVTSGGDPAAAADVAGSSATTAPGAPDGPVAFYEWPSVVLYDNGPLVNCAGCGVGGADESVLQNTSLGMSTLGFGHQLSTGNRIADDFTVPDAAGWTIDQITFFAYQTGSSTTSTMTGVNYRIWDGPPDDPASSVVFGDTSTNRLTGTAWANIYRVTEATTGSDTNRPIMADVASAEFFLPAGTYWLDWQTDGSLASGPWAPPITINGVTTTGNALQWTGAWGPANDSGTGTQQGFPFIIEGSVGVSACSTPSDIPWASVAPTTGTTMPGADSLVDVSLDSTGLPSGVYTATLCVSSNDPDTPLVEVPLELEVLATVYGVILGPDDAQSGASGDTVTYTLAITNTGNTIDTFDLAAGGSWTISLPATVTLGAGETVDLLIMVDIPPGAADGASDTAVITATSHGDPGQSDMAGLTTTALDPFVYGVALGPDDAQSGAPGDTVTYTLAITNTGNTTDTFDLAAGGSWTVSLPATVTLGAGETVDLLIMVDIPPGAADGASDTAVITATSQGDPGQSDTASLTTIAVQHRNYLPITFR